MRAMKRSRRSGLARVASVMGVTMTPGAITLTRMPLDARSATMDCDSSRTAALEAECEWLKKDVYGGRSARIDIERQTALERFSSRAGECLQRDL